MIFFPTNPIFISMFSIKILLYNNVHAINAPFFLPTFPEPKVDVAKNTMKKFLSNICL